MLYVAAMPDDIGLVVKQMRQAGVTQPIVGGDGYDTPLLLQVGGEAANDVYYSTHAYMARTSTPAIQKFYKDYQAAYGTPPENAFAALGYDTVGLIADAIKRAGSEDPPRIRDALAATQGYPGVTGTISYPAGRPRAAEDGDDDRRQGREAHPRRRGHAELHPGAVTSEKRPGAGRRSCAARTATKVPDRPWPDESASAAA